MADWPWRRAVAARPRWSRGRRHLVAPAVASRQCGRRLAGRRADVNGDDRRRLFTCGQIRGFGLQRLEG